MADINELAAMTDEEFMKHSDEEEETETSNDQETNNDTDQDKTDDPDASNQDETTDTSSGSEDSTETTSSRTTGSGTADESNTGTDSKQGESDNEGEKDTTPALDNPQQYEEFYKKIMAPIKANGKNIKLNSAEDVISLIQQGANYTKKMQSIAPYRKHLKLLEDNDLLDGDKIRFLIDISKHDKDAIKKLLSEAKIDASELSYDDEVDEEGNPKPITYYPKTPNVSDQEVQWSEAWKELLEVEQSDNIDTHSIIMNMDSTSQKQIYENPQILMLMHQTQQCGAYDKIINEMERLKILGYIKENSPFLTTFVNVKDMMLQHGLLDEEVHKLAQQNGIPQTQSFVRNNTKKKTVTNDAKAKAAAPSRSTGKSTKPFLNPLNMSDEEFMKHYDEI